MFEAIPVDVIVDTWNLRMQACDVLGDNRFPGIQGVVDGLADFGFDVQHVYAAVACEPYSDNPSNKVQQALRTTESFVNDVDQSTVGSLLKGRLTDRSGQLEEKLVDVLCAVQITRSAMEIVTGLSNARAIVVISEDIDLTPAYGMARELGVPVYAAANETVNTRPGDWLILGDASLTALCGRPRGDSGHQRKTTLAKQLLSGDIFRQFVFRYVDARTRDFVFRHRTGVVGHLPANEVQGHLNPGDVLPLYPVDLLPASGTSAGFPLLRLSATKPVASQPQYLVEGTVLEWLQPTRVRVQKDDGSERSFDAAPGTLLPGTRVAMYHAPGSRSRLIGALERLPALDDWATPSKPKVATVQTDGTSRGATVRAIVEGLSTPVALLPPSQEIARKGSSFAVVPRAEDNGRVTKVVAVSSALRASEVTVKT